MQTFLVVHVCNEVRQVRLGLREGRVVVEVHLLPFERAKEVFGFRVVILIANRRLAGGPTGTRGRLGLAATRQSRRRERP